jgi:hypothetical protein
MNISNDETQINKIQIFNSARSKLSSSKILSTKFPIPLLTFGGKKVKNLPLINQIKKKLTFLEKEFTSNSLKLNFDGDFFNIDGYDSDTIQISV